MANKFMLNYDTRGKKNLINLLQIHHYYSTFNMYYGKIKYITSYVYQFTLKNDLSLLIFILEPAFYEWY